jgi:hypothetical protein
MRLSFLLVASLTATGCQDKLADKAEDAAERVTKRASHLRHERRELAVAVAKRADDRAAGHDPTAHVDEIAGHVKHVAREAGRYAEAEQDFIHLRALRIASLRAEHSVAASQPLLIVAIAGVKDLRPELRTRLDENLAIFRQRLARTRERIEQLRFANAADWERRDDEVGHEMAGLYLARDASWQALDEHPRDDGFPAT